MKADGTIWIDTKIDESGMEDGFNRMRDGADDVAVSFRNAGKVIEKSFSNINFNKTIENLKAQIRSLEDEFASVSREFEDAVKFDDDKAAEKLGAKRAKIYDRIARLREKLAVEVAAAASKEAAAEEKASRRVVAAEEKEAAKRKQLNNDLVNAGNSASYFGNRLRGIVSSALIFNVISAGLRTVTSYFGSALMANNQFASAVASLKMSLRTAFQPIYEAMLPALTTLVNWLNVAVQAVGRFFAALAGKSYKTMQKNAQSLGSAIESAGSSSETVKDTTDAVGNMGNALEDTGQKAKEAEKYLAGFDEINRMIKPAEDLSSNSSSNVPTIPDNAQGKVELGEVTAEDFGFEDKISPKIEAIVQKIKELIEPLKNIDLSPLIEAFNRFKEALRPITKGLFAGLEWAWHNLLVPLAKWTIEDLLPAFLDLLSAALKFLHTVIEGLKPLAEWLWTKFLQPLAEWTGGIIIDVIHGIADALNKISDWISQHQTEVNAFIAAVGSIAGLSAVVTTLATIVTAIKEIALVMKGAQLVMSPLALTISGWITQIGAFFGAIATKITGFGTVIAAWGAKIAGFFSSVWNSMSGFFSAIGSALVWIAEALGISVGWVVAIVAAVAAAVAAIIVYWDELVLWAQSVGERLSEIWQSILKWIEDVKTKYDELKTRIIKWAQETSKAINDQFITRIREWFDELIQRIREWFNNAREIIVESFNKAATYVENNFVSPIKKWMQNIRETVSTIFETIKDRIISNISNAASGIDTKFIVPMNSKFKALENHIVSCFQSANGKIKDVFQTLRQWFADKVTGPIWDLFDDVVDKVIDGLNRMAREISNLLTSANRRVTTTTTYKTTTVAASAMYAPTPAIPMLARGAVIPPNQKFLAVLGDQRHGTNIEAPLETIQEAVALVMDDMVQSNLVGFEGVISVLQEILEAVMGIEIGDQVIADAVQRYQRKMAVVRGG